MRRQGRTDDNQQRIVNALRKAGAQVVITSGHGYGLPDLLVAFRQQTHLLEVKNKQGRGTKLTEAEQFFVDHWRGGPVAVVTDEAEALRAIGIES